MLIEERQINKKSRVGNPAFSFKKSLESCLEMRFENIQDFIFWLEPCHPFDGFAIFYQHQSWHPHDIILDGDILVAINIHVNNFDLVLQLFG